MLQAAYRQIHLLIFKSIMYFLDKICRGNIYRKYGKFLFPLDLEVSPLIYRVEFNTTMYISGENAKT